MKRIFIISVIIFTVLSGSTIAQQLDASKISAIQSVLEKYEKYNQFTTDGYCIDANYTKGFIDLFDSQPNQSIYNEAYSIGGQMFSFKTAQAYVESITKSFPYGLDVDLDLEHMKVVENFIEEGKNYYIVEVNKKITGLYLIKSFHRYNKKAYIFLTDAVGDKPGDMKITGVLEPSSYQKYSGSKRTKGFYAGISAGYGLSTVTRSTTESFYDEYYDTYLEANSSFNLELYYMFNRNLGLGTGIGMSTFSSTTSLNSSYSVTSSTMVQDIDGNSYYRIFNLTKMEENQTYKCVDIPLLIKLRTGKGRTGVYFDLGVVYSFVSASYTMDISGSRYGYYPYIDGIPVNLIIDGNDAPEYDFGQFNGKIEDQELPAPKSAISGLFGVGLSIPFSSSGLYMKLGIQTRISFTNMAQTENYAFSYCDLTGDSGKTSLINFSGQIGLAYNLNKLIK
jgi:hypothetical protein